VLLALAGCGPAPDSVATQLLKAVNAGDLDAALSLFARRRRGQRWRFQPLSRVSGEIQTWLQGLFADKVNLTELEILNQDENSFRARYSLTMASASSLGVASLEGTGRDDNPLGRNHGPEL